MRHAPGVLSEVAPQWLLEHMDPAWAERYEKRFSDFRLPKEEKKRAELAETIGSDGRRLFEQVCAESRLPWLRELGQSKRCGVSVVWTLSTGVKRSRIG